MVVRKQIERRRLVHRALRLGQPLFMEVPKTRAALILAACTLLSIFAGSVAPASIELGSIFLLICAFAAWFVGNRYAILLGMFIVLVQYLDSLMINFREAKIDEVVDFAFQLGCSTSVVLMLGVARVALEIEWRLARTDPLTGALNRKAFFEIIESEGRSDNLAMLVFADLDGLKGFNDEFGHKRGDEALRKFAECIRQSIRKHDIFARIGGDEFVIFLYVRDLAGAQSFVDRLHNAVNLQSEVKSELKCSLGALLLPVGSKSIDLELSHADKLMYDAKRNKAGFSIAILTEPEHAKIVQIASGINAQDLEAAKTRLRRQLTKKSDAVGSKTDPIAA